MKTSLKVGFAQIFSCCPKNLSCPKLGGAADLALNTRAFPANSRPHTMHNSWYKTRIPRMWSDLKKTRYTVDKVPLTKNSLSAPLVARNKGFV